MTERAICPPHPASRLYAWVAYDETLVVCCSECGAVLQGQGGAEDEDVPEERSEMDEHERDAGWVR